MTSKLLNTVFTSFDDVSLINNYLGVTKNFPEKIVIFIVIVLYVVWLYS